MEIALQYDFHTAKTDVSNVLCSKTPIKKKHYKVDWAWKTDHGNGFLKPISAGSIKSDNLKYLFVRLSL
jgi:hypothetical protein